MARQYFDQGLRLTYGLDPRRGDEFVEQGLEQDSTSAMSLWGMAYALGPQHQFADGQRAGSPAWEAMHNAVRYSVNVTPEERDYIDALAQRYRPTPRPTAHLSTPPGPARSDGRLANNPTTMTPQPCTPRRSWI